MKISNVSTLVMGSAWRNLTFLKLTTDEGLVGVSEVRLSNRTNALLGYLEECKKRYILGSDPTRIELMVQRMFRDDYGRVGEILASAISLVEMACWDIVGKKANLPVYVLLGGAVRDRIKAYANAWYQVPRTPDDFGKAAVAAVAKGYRALKFDPFGAGYYEMERKDRVHCVSLVEAVRGCGGAGRRTADRDARAIQPGDSHSHFARPGAVRSNLGRGTGACRQYQGAGQGGPSYPHTGRDR